MNLFQYKPLQIGFLVLCPDRNPESLRSTAHGLGRRYPHSPVLASVPDGTDKNDIAQMINVCDVVKGSDTITSLINAGFSSPKADWTVILMAGSHAKGNLDKKYSLFIESEKDILFPIVNWKTDFVDGTLNGIMIHRDTWAEVGPFCNKTSLPVCKALWSLNAIDKGCRFKAVIGAQIC